MMKIDRIDSFVCVEREAFDFVLTPNTKKHAELSIRLNEK